MPGPLLPEVQEKLPWLFQELGFRVTRDEYDYKSFGNSLVDLSSDYFRLRFVRDMGSILVQVASPAVPEDWLALPGVLEAIGGEPAEKFTGGWELEAVASLVRDNLEAITEAIGPKLPETKQEMRRRNELRIAAAPPVPKPSAGMRLRRKWQRLRRVVSRLLVGGL